MTADRIYAPNVHLFAFHLYDSENSDRLWEYYKNAIVPTFFLQPTLDLISVSEEELGTRLELWKNAEDDNALLPVDGELVKFIDGELVDERYITGCVYPLLIYDNSNYKRLQRFLRHFELDYAQLARVFMALMDIPQLWVLSIDRTEWSLGLTRLNILMLGIVHQGVAIPVLWTMLDKKGNSDSQERMDLIDRFQQVFPEVQVAFLSADREFVGKE